MSPKVEYRNLALSHLDPADLALLEPHLKTVDLPLRYRLSDANRTIEAVYFLEHGIASDTISVAHKAPIEIGIIGREGVTNLPVILGMSVGTSNVFMQIAGHGRAIPAARLRTAMEESHSLTRSLLFHVHVFMVQAASTVVANAQASVPERLARWLLMAHDRVDSPLINLTHEFLATMLGVRRAGVSNALRDFVRQDLVIGSRGVITIVDREGLERIADGYYGASEAVLRRHLSFI